MGNLQKNISTQTSKELQRWAGFTKALVNPPINYERNREAIWRLNKTTLWYYEPKERKYNVPLLLIYSLINQPSILDLGPENSLIQTLMDEGFEVYLLDFGVPGYEDKDSSLDDYVTKYIQRGVRRALAHSGAKEISLIGFCLGGTLLTMYASIAKEPIKNIILSLTPIDFRSFPKFDQWQNSLVNKQIEVDPILDAMGLVPASFVKGGMRLITSPVYYSHYLSLLNRGADSQYREKWGQLNKWTNGHIPMTSAAMKQIVNDLIIDNKLIEGRFEIDGYPASLSNISANLLVIGSNFDQLVTRDQITPIMDLVSSTDKTIHLLNSGHASLPENGAIPSYLANWLPARSVS